MEFRVLGPLEVIEGGRALDLGPHRQRAVLALLLINAGRVVSLDRLIDQLWREQPPPRATASLQAYISRLRKILEPGRHPRDPAELLVTQPPGYVLRIDETAIDARRFEALASQGRRLLDENRARAAEQVLSDALGLWRGDAFEEFAYEPFAEGDIGRLEELRRAVIEDHLVAQLALGQHAAAVPHLEALVAEHPLRERLWELLMVALYRAGRQSEALRAYQSARAALTAQLGLEPGPNLRRLEADILSQAESLEWRPVEPQLAAPSAPAARSEHEEAAEPRSRLIGREAPMAKLVGVSQRALDGRGGVVLVVGEAGIGKTRLLREFAGAAETIGFRVAWGDTHEGAAELPFWPWAQLLRSFVRPSEAAGLRDALGPVAGDVVHVVPDLAEALGTSAAGPRMDPEAARFRAFDGIARLLIAHAQQQPLLAVLEDLHWADEGSLQLLAFLASRLRGQRIALVGSYRPTDVSPAHPLGEALAALAREEVVTRLSLSGLNHAQVAELIEATTGGTPSAAVVSVVHERTDGNPFFASELVRLMVSERTLEEDVDTLSKAIPAGVTDVVSRRVRRLPEPTVRLLALASVLGRQIDLAELTASARDDIGQVIEELEPAVLTGILVEDPDVVARLRFSHALVQETVYSGLTSVRRAQLHGAVARALDALVGDDDERAPELARHHFLAGPIADPALAFKYALRAADVSRDRFLYDQALLHLDRALAVLGRLPEGLDRDRRELEVLTRRSVVLALTEGYASDEMATASTRAHDLSLQVGDTHQLTAALWSVWAMWVVRAEFLAGEDFAQHLLQLGFDTGDVRPSIGGHQATGAIAVHRGAPAAGRRHLIEAIRLADAVDDPSLPETFLQHPAVFSRGFLAVADWLLGDSDAATVHSSEAVALARRLGHPFTLSLALFFDAWLGAFQDNPELVVERAHEAVDLSDAHGFALVSEMSAVLAGWAHARRGRPAEGCALAADGLARMEARNARMLRHFFLGLLADAHSRAGKHDDALRLVDDALAEAEQVGERFYEPELHRLRADLLARLGRVPQETVQAGLDRSRAIARAQGSAGFESRIAGSLERLAARACASPAARAGEPH